MIRWFRRAPGQPADAVGESIDEDSPEALLRGLGELVDYINRNAGRLPAETTVLARQVTDVLWSVIQSSEGRPLDVNAVITVRAITGDYLPTTLRAYLALDPSSPRVRELSPQDTLRDQVEMLWESAADVLKATVEQDVNELMVQGKFLKTKFTRSDLEL